MQSSGIGLCACLQNVICHCRWESISLLFVARSDLSFGTSGTHNSQGSSRHLTEGGNTEGFVEISALNKPVRESVKD